MKASRRNKEEQNAARELAKRHKIPYATALSVIRNRKLIREELPAHHNVIQTTGEGEKTLIAEGEPRVLRSPLVPAGEYMALNSWDSADGKTRLLLSQNASDEEFKAAEEALAESDQALATMEKVTKYVESFESDEDVIARCRGDIPQEHFGKITYRTNEGYETQAYINMETGEGTSKHTGLPVVVRYIEQYDEWRQVDPWLWHLEPTGDFYRVNADGSRA